MARSWFLALVGCALAFKPGSVPRACSSTLGKLRFDPRLGKKGDMRLLQLPGPASKPKTPGSCPPSIPRSVCASFREGLKLKRIQRSRTSLPFPPEATGQLLATPEESAVKDKPLAPATETLPDRQQRTAPSNPAHEVESPTPVIPSPEVDLETNIGILGFKDFAGDEETEAIEHMLEEEVLQHPAGDLFEDNKAEEYYDPYGEIGTMVQDDEVPVFDFQAALEERIAQHPIEEAVIAKPTTGDDLLDDSSFTEDFEAFIEREQRRRTVQRRQVASSDVLDPRKTSPATKTKDGKSPSGGRKGGVMDRGSLAASTSTQRSAGKKHKLGKNSPKVSELSNKYSKRLEALRRKLGVDTSEGPEENLVPVLDPRFKRGNNPRVQILEKELPDLRKQQGKSRGPVDGRRASRSKSIRHAELKSPRRQKDARSATDNSVGKQPSAPTGVRVEHPAGVIMPLEGVLLDTSSIHKRVWTNLATRHGVAPPRSENLIPAGSHSPYVKPGFEAWIDRLFPGTAMPKHESLHREFMDDILSEIRGATPNDVRMTEAGAWVDEILDSNVRVSLVTQLPQREAKALLHAASLDPEALGPDAIVAAPDLSDEAVVLRKAALRMSRKPDQCVVVTNTPEWTPVAQKAGMRSVAFKGNLPISSLEGSDAIFERLESVKPDHLRRLVDNGEK